MAIRSRVDLYQPRPRRSTVARGGRAEPLVVISGRHEAREGHPSAIFSGPWRGSPIVSGVGWVSGHGAEVTQLPNGGPSPSRSRREHLLEAIQPRRSRRDWGGNTRQGRGGGTNDGCASPVAANFGNQAVDYVPAKSRVQCLLLGLGPTLFFTLARNGAARAIPIALTPAIPLAPLSSIQR